MMTIFLTKLFLPKKRKTSSTNSFTEMKQEMVEERDETKNDGKEDLSCYCFKQK